MGLQAAIAAIQAVMRGMTGIRYAPDYPLDAINVYPYAVCFAGSGEWRQEPALWKKGLHTITLQVHWARKDLPRDVGKAMLFAESIPNAIMKDPTLAGTVDTVLDPISYTFGVLSWGGTENIGFEFKIMIKVQSAIT